MLSLKELHDGQNHSFSNVSSSDERNFSKELLKLSAMRTDTMSSFSSLIAEKKGTVACYSSSQGVRE